MMTNRSLFAAAAIVAFLLFGGCQTAQKSGSPASPAPAEKSETPQDTKKVTGINGWEGEITGKSAAGSKFTKLKIGMTMRQVTDLIGQPTDQGSYVTGKAWIPYYYGSDRYRHEMVYKRQGRLVFAGGSVGDYSGSHLIWIIHNAQESGYR